MARRQNLYEQVYETIREAIESGRYQAGSQIPTEKELSDRFNVSRITIRRALSQLTDQGLVERIPGKGSFVRSSTSVDARPRLSPNGIRRIGFVGQDLGIAYGMGLLMGIEEESRKHGLSLIIRISGGVQKAEQAAIKEMLDNGVDGLIVFPVNGESYNPVLLQLHLSGLPIVLVDRYFKGVDISAVCSENEASVKEAVNYLMDLGHRQIALLSPPPEDTVTIEDRIRGYVAAFTERGIPIDHSLVITDLTTCLPGKEQEEAYRRDKEKVMRFLQDRPEVTALIAVEYNLAAVVQSVSSAIGKAIPQDLSVICFDAPSLNYGGEDAFFTHIRQDERGMGRRAVQLLSSLIQGNGKKTRSMLPATLVHGRSTSPPRSC